MRLNKGILINMHHNYALILKSLIPVHKTKVTKGSIFFKCLSLISSFDT